MANFEPKEFNASDINGGQKFRNGDGISAEAINAPIESALLMQGLATTQPQYIEDGGNPSVTIKNGQFVFANLKGKDGSGGGGGGSIEGIELTETTIKITKPLEINIEGKEEILSEKYNFNNVDEYVSIGDASQYVVNGGLYLYIPYLTGQPSNYDGTEVYDSDIQFIPIGSGLSTYDVGGGYEFSLHIGGTASDCYLYCSGYSPYAFTDVQIVDKVIGGKATISPSGNADLKLPDTDGTLATKEWVRTQVDNSGGSSGGDYYITAQLLNASEHYASYSHYLALPTSVSKIVLEKIIYVYYPGNSAPSIETTEVNRVLEPYSSIEVQYLDGMVDESYNWIDDNIIYVTLDFYNGIFGTNVFNEPDLRLVESSYFLFRVTP